MGKAPLLAIDAADVHAILARHILADGYDLVMDYERSHGSWVYDSRSGREYLDFLTFFASSPVGYNHPRLKDPDFLALLQRVALVKPSLSDIYSSEYASFVDTFARHAMPPYLHRAFFIEGGTLGVENALKAAFDWKVRRNRRKGETGIRGQQILHFRQAFHGRSGYALSLTNTDPVKTDLFPRFDWPRISNPGLRFPITETVLKEVEAAEQLAQDEIRRAFDRCGDDIAAIIIEPVQAEGGDIQFRPGFLRSLQATARERECLFIVDEVQSGVGLTGRFWAHQHFGLEPDLLAFGKKTQVCGCLAGPRIDEEPDNVFRLPSRINSTWGGGLTDMVRCARFLEIIAEEGLVENARIVGERLLGALRSLELELGGLVSNTRGLGLMLAFDLPTREIRDRAHERIVEHGLLALTCGPRSIRFRPPLNLSASEADEAVERTRAALKML